MCRDPFLRDLVHILRSDLHLERLPVGTNHRGVERLVKIIPWRGDPILYSTWYRSPGVVDNAKGSIAMPYFVWRNHASRNQIVNLVEIDLLPSQFLPDGI